MPHEQRRRHHATSVPLLALALTLVVAFFWYRREHASRPWVTLATARVGPLVAPWSATGYVEARTAQVGAPLFGRLVSLPVEEGDRVRAGDVVARVVSNEQQAAVRGGEAGRESAAAQAGAAEATLRATDRLLTQQLKRAEAEREAAASRLQQAEASLRRSRSVVQAELAAARAAADAALHQLRDLESGPRREEIAEAEAALAAAAATATRARSERDRVVALWRQGYAARSNAEVAHEDLLRAEAAVRQRRANLELLRRGYRPEEIAAARARLRAAEEGVAVAEARRAGLDTEERAVEEMSARVEAAEAAVAEARSARLRLEALRQEARAAHARTGQSAAAVDQARAQLVELAVVAPFDGMVGRRLANLGDLASPLQPLLSVVEVDRAWVTAEVDEQDLAAVRAGQQVSITAPAYPGRSFAGRVTIVGAQAVPQTDVRTGARIVRVRVSLEPTRAADRPLLKPGMEVDVAGVATLASRAVLVPNDAILTDAEGAFVYTLAAKRVRRRPVRVGYASPRETEIVAGLEPGEAVVVSGKEGLTDGARVTVPRTSRRERRG